MEINLTPEQSDVVRHAVETGRVHDPEQAVQEALVLWMERERCRAELLASLDAAEASLSRGEGIPITQASMLQLAADVKQRGRQRLARKVSEMSTAELDAISNTEMDARHNHLNAELGKGWI